MGLTLRAVPAKLVGSLRLPGSKSSSNRWLIIQALSGQNWELNGLSTANDTWVLQKALAQNQGKINVGAAGTAMRFMTAYLAQKPGKYELLGEDRAHDRPIAILVDALRELGAEIDYLEKEDYPPLQIKGKKLLGGDLKIDASVSSQYLTALLLTAAKMKNGLRLHWEGDLSSAPYVNQTLAILQEAGISCQLGPNEIRVSPGEFKRTVVQIEADWSSAAYWLAFACLLPSQLHLFGLKSDSPQADKRALAYLSELGLQYRFVHNGLLVWREETNISAAPSHFDCNNCPDLAPTLIVLCAALGRQANFIGLKSLRIKESDRLLALQTELAKFGAVLSISEDSAQLLNGCTAVSKTIVSINSWQDHRIAMAMSLLAAVGYQLYLDTPKVVAKSYPAFWEDLAKFGFQLEQEHGR